MLILSIELKYVFFYISISIRCLLSLVSLFLSACFSLFLKIMKTLILSVFGRSFAIKI